MATTVTTPKPKKVSKKEKNMNPNVATSEASENLNPAVYAGKVTKKVENPIDGKEITMEGSFTVPLAQSITEAYEQSKGNETDVLFWYNHGRKLAGRQQLTAALSFDLEDENLNDLYSAFSNARKNMLDKNATPEKIKRVNDFILGEEKFAPLKEKLDNFKVEPLAIDFAETEIKKPSGIRGRRKKEDSEESES